MQTSRERQCLQHCYVSLQVLSVVGLLQDETDPMVSVMKVQSAALASSACVHAIHFNTAAQSVHLWQTLPVIFVTCTTLTARLHLFYQGAINDICH